MILRPYQEMMVGKAIEALDDKGNTLAVAPTGSGKTVILSAVAAKLGGRQCVLQHRDELTAQNESKYRLFNPNSSTSIYNASEKSWRGDCTFAMVPTLSRHLDSIPRLDTLVIDEAHHAVAPTYQRIVDTVLDRNPDCRIFGVTATPARGDGVGLRPIFSNCCCQISMGSLIRLGFLVPPKTYVCELEGTGEQLEHLDRTASGEFDMDAAEQILNREVHNETVFAKWKELAGDRKTIVFASTVKHAEDVCQVYKAHGVKAELVTGATPEAERKAILSSFDKKDMQVLVNVAVLTEGYDSQPVSCIVLLRPCSFKSTMIQMIGRGLRTVDQREYPGVVKDDCVILDFGNSLKTHKSLETAVKLDGGTRLCPKCDAEIPTGLDECPICGADLRIPERERTPKETEGEDAEFQGEKLTDVVMAEIDIMNASPFEWCDLFHNGKVMIASGFECFTAVCSLDAEHYVAMGKMQNERRMTRLLTGSKAVALAAADDFIRMNETDDNARKNKRWLHDPVTEKQIRCLKQAGYQPGTMLSFTKYSAACALNFHWNLNLIEEEMLNGKTA